MIFSYLLNMQSHPSWVCGLKQQTFAHAATVQGSHPSWVCGLKLISSYHSIGITESHPSWVCGLKLVPWLQHAARIGHTLRGCVD